MANGRKSALLLLLLSIAGAGYAYPPAPGIESSFPDEQAAAQAVQGSVIAGFDGFYRIGKCMCIRIRLENTGSDLACEVAIPVAEDLFTQSLSLPSPSRKTLVMYLVPRNNLRELEISLSAGAKPIATFRAAVQRLADEERLHVVSSTLQASYPALDGSYGINAMERRIFIDPTDLPENWSAYTIVDAVTLDASDTTRLNEAQRTALSRWVLLGGSVSLTRWDGAGVRQWTLPSDVPQPGSRTAPGASRFATAHGLGMFRFIRAPDRQLIHATDDQDKVGRISLPELDQEIFRICALRNPVARGSLAWYLAAFLLLYALAIVVWLARSSPAGSEKALKWRVVPAISILFSFLSLGLGAVANAGEVSMRQFSVTHVFPGTADTFTTSLVTVLSPQAAAYQLSPNAASAYLVQDQSGDYGLAHRYVFDAKGDPSARVDMDLWATKTFSIASFSNKGQFWILRRADSWILANRSRLPLRGCALIGPGGAGPLGDLPAGQELQLGHETEMPEGGQTSEGAVHSVMLSRVTSHYQTEVAAGTLGRCVICALEGVTPSLASVGSRTAYEGSTALVFHLGPIPGNDYETNRR